MTNRLKSEKSPYLLEHAENPVDWFPWGSEAFLKAKKEDKPIFLSIGYSACHWCHVMARESFEDKETAEYLNKNFISIKVDREEQPDVDLFYMNVCQKLTGSGGWPLSVFMTPERRPFFAGTYFPKRTYGNIPAFIAVLQEIARLWKTDRKRLVTAADQIVKEMESDLKPVPVQGATGLKDLASSTFHHLRLAFDRKHGGFGTAPKFPTASFLDLLLSLYQVDKSQEAMDMARISLERMRLGGIWDHVGGGFHRYSVDERWLVPHFEKMLYDQALLIQVYSRAFELMGDRFFLDTAKQIAGFTMGELMSPEGGFYSALDADSEGKEGTYYVWSIDELRKVLGDKDLRIFRQVFMVEEAGNFQDGKNVLALKDDYGALSKRLGMPRNQIEDFVKKAMERLRAERQKRTPPGRDEKIITSWNALMVCALVHLSRVSGDLCFMETAKRCLLLIIKGLLREEGLKRRLIKGEAGCRACLEDYACLLMAACDVCSETGDEQLLRVCTRLVSEIRSRFYDKGLKTLLFSPLEAKDIPAKVKPPSDGPLPSPVAVLFQALLRLQGVFKNEETEELLEIVKKQGLWEALKNPLGNCHYLAYRLGEHGQ